MMRVVMISVAAAVLFMMSPAYAACTNEPASGNPNTLTTSRMQTASGEPCTIRHVINHYSNSEQRTRPTTRLRIDRKPQHGTVSLNGSRITYVSAKGFRGSDSFGYSSHHPATKTRPARVFRYQKVINVY